MEVVVPECPLREIDRGEVVCMFGSGICALDAGLGMGCGPWRVIEKWHEAECKRCQQTFIARRKGEY